MSIEKYKQVPSALTPREALDKALQDTGFDWLSPLATNEPAPQVATNLLEVCGGSGYFYRPTIKVAK